MTERRKVYMVLSPRALSYARDALESLFRNSTETLHLSLITDEEQDKAQLSEAMDGIASSAHVWQVYSETELTEDRKSVV